MSETLQRNWADECRAEGEARGTLRTLRKTLRDLQTARFQALPEELTHRIDTCVDPERLESAILRVLTLQGLEQFQL
jgi:hypothetical protein